MAARLQPLLLPAVLAAGLVVLAALYGLAARSVIELHQSRQLAALEADARRLAAGVAARWDAAAAPRATAPCPAAAGLQVRIVLPGGGAACAPPAPVQRAAAPESVALAAARARALEGHVVLDGTGLPDAMAVTVPIRRGQVVVAALQALRAPLLPPSLGPLRGAFVAAALAWLLALLVLVRLRGQGERRRVAALADALPQGVQDAAAPLAAARADPLLEPLAEALHRREVAVQSRVGVLDQQLEEREAVLASMGEGVLAVDPGGNLLNLNAAAGRMFGSDPALARGRHLLEVIRQPVLQRFVQDALAAPTPLERELVLHGEEPRTLAAHGTALRDPHGQRLGTLVVLNDVTHLRRLERMRQDFVANVSHEIKTPITSIKAAVETLLDGAMAEPETARRFLEIVARHAERLNAITDDLLNLSRIEQEAERGALHTEHVALAELLAGAVSVCAAKAAARQIQVQVRCAPALHAVLNGQLVEQAVVNLVDNAVKYAPAGTTVHVRAAHETGGLVIQVRDEGPGIPPEHLPRLFERFYRVDKSRSRQAGGTGLGLAIVKHIAQTHGGRVSVASRPGEGSTFALHLPAAPPSA